MDFVDRILKLLIDSRWHSIEELEKNISVPKDKISQILGFLYEQAFVNIQNKKIMITDKGLKLMQL